MRDGFPWVDNEHPKLVNPLLKINLVCELVSAAAIFSSSFAYVCSAHYTHTQPGPLGYRGNIAPQSAVSPRPARRGSQPSMILDAHGWPQWDVWILPFYLFAALAALKNPLVLVRMFAWIGAMLKGPLVLVTPFFVLWPLWQKRWMSALRVLAGFTATAALIVSPWLLRTPGAWIAFAVVAGASLLAALRLQVAASKRVACRNSRVRRVCNGHVVWQKLRVV